MSESQPNVEARAETNPEIDTMASGAQSGVEGVKHFADTAAKLTAETPPEPGLESAVENAIEDAADRVADPKDLKRVVITLSDGRTQSFLFTNPLFNWSVDQAMDAMELMENVVADMNSRVDAIDELKELLLHREIRDKEIDAVVKRLGETQVEAKFNLLSVMKYIREEHLILKFLATFYVPTDAEYSPTNAETYEAFYRRFETQHLLGVVGHFFGGTAGFLEGGSLASLLQLILPLITKKTGAADVVKSVVNAAG